MDKKIVLLVLILLPLLILGENQANSVAAEPIPIDPEIKTYVHPEGELPEELQGQLENRAVTAFTHMAMHGSGWMLENPGIMKFNTYGWGTRIQPKWGYAPRHEWTHISIPYPTFLDGTALKLDFVQFCAKSANGSTNYPDAIHLWSQDGRFFTSGIAWPADNKINCVSVWISPATWYPDLGISVGLQFNNQENQIIMYKAWAEFVP